jgi:NADH-quinone oxidoreductase subunit A
MGHLNLNSGHDVAAVLLVCDTICRMNKNVSITITPGTMLMALVIGAAAYALWLLRDIALLVLTAIVIASAIAGLLLAVPWLVNPLRRTAAKVAPYECGFEPFDSARRTFNVQFYLVAILFIVFDLEVAFLFPWAMVIQDISWFGFGSMMVFLSVLTLGFVYEWQEGALEWE